MAGNDSDIFAPERWHLPGRGPRYAQLQRHIAAAIRDGLLQAGAQLPPERELAERAGISRVTVRKAIGALVAEGLIEQRRGAGSFVREAEPPPQHSLSLLVSFTENMRARGKIPSSRVLEQGLFVPTPQELMTLGLGTGERVARVRRLRSADGVPMAIETSALPEDILPRPEQVRTSLYEVLRAAGRGPTRANQRISAINLGEAEARLLEMPPGAAVLLIDRTAYLGSGRPIEFTRGLYRPDLFDFVTELRMAEPR